MRRMVEPRVSKIVLEPAINVYSREEFIRRVGLAKVLDGVIHFDVADGFFARPKNFNDPRIIFNEIDSSNVHLHLRVNDTAGEMQKWMRYNPKRITLHVESPDFSVEKLQIIRRAGIEAGLAINLSTMLETVIPYIDEVDFVLLLSSSPGGRRRNFMPNVVQRVRALRNRFPEIKLGVEGVIGVGQISELEKVGVDNVCVESVFLEGIRCAAPKICSNILK